MTRDDGAVARRGHVETTATTEGSGDGGQKESPASHSEELVVDLADGCGDLVDGIGRGAGQGLAQLPAGIGPAVAGDSVHYHVQKIPVAKVAGQHAVFAVSGIVYQR